MKRIITLSDGSTTEYELTKKKVKNLNLRIDSNGFIKVSAPRSLPDAQIEKFIVSKTAFIKKAVAKTESYQNDIPDGLTDARLRMYDEACKVRILGLCEETYPIFKKMGVEYPVIKFRRMKNTWGNCRPKEGILTFNKNLAFKSEDFCEYVVMHEFAHFIYPNHSKDFYALLDRLMPDWREKRENK